MGRELQEYSTTLYLRQVWREHRQRRQVWRDERLAFGALDDNHGRSVTPFIRHITSHNFGNFSYPPRNLPFLPWSVLLPPHAGPTQRRCTVTFSSEHIRFCLCLFITAAASRSTTASSTACGRRTDHVRAARDRTFETKTDISAP